MGVARRQRAADAFDLMFRQSFDQVPKRGEVSDLTIRAINGGIRGIVYRRVRSGKPEQLRDHLEKLLHWGLLYQRPSGASVPRLPVGELTPSLQKASELAEDASGWDEPPDSVHSRATLTQRERILRAAAKVAAERGFGSLSIPAITAAAGVSNQTFYEKFASKQEAFGVALDILVKGTLGRVSAAIEAEDDWVEGVRAGSGNATQLPRRKPTARPAAHDRGAERGTSRLGPSRSGDGPIGRDVQSRRHSRPGGSAPTGRRDRGDWCRSLRGPPKRGGSGANGGAARALAGDQLHCAGAVWGGVGISPAAVA